MKLRINTLNLVFAVVLGGNTYALDLKLDQEVGDDTTGRGRVAWLSPDGQMALILSEQNKSPIKVPGTNFSWYPDPDSCKASYGWELPTVFQAKIIRSNQIQLTPFQEGRSGFFNPIILATGEKDRQGNYLSVSTWAKDKNGGISGEILNLDNGFYNQDAIPTKLESRVFCVRLIENLKALTAYPAINLVTNILVNGNFEEPDTKLLSGWTVNPVSPTNYGWKTSSDSKPATVIIEAVSELKQYGQYIAGEYEKYQTTFLEMRVGGIVSKTFNVTENGTYALSFDYNFRGQGTSAKVGIQLDQNTETIVDLSYQSKLQSYNLSLGNLTVGDHVIKLRILDGAPTQPIFDNFNISKQ